MVKFSIYLKRRFRNASCVANQITTVYANLQKNLELKREKLNFCPLFHAACVAERFLWLTLCVGADAVVDLSVIVSVPALGESMQF